MTTNVKVMAHPGSNLKVCVTTIDKVEGKETRSEQIVEDGKEVTVYATDSRSILVEEVPVK